MIMPFMASKRTKVMWAELPGLGSTMSMKGATILALADAAGCADATIKRAVAGHKVHIDIAVAISQALEQRQFQRAKPGRKRKIQ